MSHEKVQNEKTYTCPMHPEVQSDQPGSCPKCKMRLVEKGPNSEQKSSNSQHR